METAIEVAELAGFAEDEWLGEDDTGFAYDDELTVARA